MTQWPPPFQLPMACFRCAGPLDIVNGTTNGALSIAILECLGCDRQYELSMRLNDHQDPDRRRRAERRKEERRAERERVGTHG